MNLYSQDDERAIRAQRMVHDWTKSGLLDESQRDQIMPGLQVDLRRTNMFLRATLFVFGFMIVQSFGGLVAITLGLDESVYQWLALIAAGACVVGAQTLIARYKLYHFGVEEAAAIAAAVFFVIFIALVQPAHRLSTTVIFAAATAAAYALFLRFGYVYAGVAATILAPAVIFSWDQSDTLRRLLAFTLLLTIFFIARERRLDHDDEYPGDAYGLISAVAWAAMYFDANLKVSGWWSVSDNVPAFEWGTYAVVWLVPMAGLWIAIRDRHRAMLDVNIVLAIVTLMTNKLYLGLQPKPWDPIVFGAMLVAVALGLRRWLASGPSGSRNGFVAERLLASERQRLAMAGSATVLAPGAPPAHAHSSGGPSVGGGGTSGGGGASGSF